MKASAAAGAGALTLGAASSPAAGQSLVEEECERDAVWQIGEYFETYNNQWSNPDAEQCLQRFDDGSFGWRFDGGDCSGGDENYCINYPEVYIGERPWGTDTGAPEFQGLTRGDVDELVMEWDAEIDINGTFNLTEEWWLLDGSPGEEPPITHEIMLVCDWGGGHSSDHEPFEEYGVWTDQFGNTVDYWSRITGGTGDEFHIFGLSQPQSAGKVDLKPIIDFLTEREGLSEDKQLTGIELGTETFDGPTGSIRFREFNVTINGTTYESGSGADLTPAEPEDVTATAVSTSSIEVSWSGVDEADEYNVYADGDSAVSVSTSTTITGLDPGTEYTVEVESVNDSGTSDRVAATATTEEAEPEDCEGAAGSPETLSNGQTVCDVDGDGAYMDVSGDGSVSNTDVTEFFGNQHVDPWDSRADLFDFNGDTDVSQADVIELFTQV